MGNDASVKKTAMIVANDYMLGATFFDGKKDMFPIPKQYRNNKIEEVQDLRACGMFQIYIYAACFRSICSILFRHWMAEYFKSLKLWLFGVFFDSFSFAAPSWLFLSNASGSRCL